MSEQSGHIELQRTIDSIVIGSRHREELGDIEALMRSIERVGLLQPVTITPDGVLVCGRRRLEAVKRLGWRTLKVWVRSGISDTLSRLLAERDENEQRKDLNEVEQATLYDEISRLVKEDAARRQAATRFGSGAQSGSASGGGESPPPEAAGKTRDQASRMVTGRASYHRHEQVNEIRRIAEDPMTPAVVQRAARKELAAIIDGAKVNGSYGRIKDALALASAPVGAGATPADVERRDRGDRASAHDRGARRSVRAFLLTWGDLDGWSRYYDSNEIAAQLKDSDWEMFERVLAETLAFAEDVRELRVAPTAIPA